MADMVSTTIRMILELPNTGLNLSPQPPIDALALKENEDVANFVSDPELGLETSVTYPYWREERHHSRWSAESYRARGKPRYYLNKIDGVSGRQAIRQKLEEHFLGNGRKFPFVGDLFTGELNDRDQATSRFENNTIYSHDAWNHIKADHSVLIVGIDVSNPQAPYVEVKCTWGEHYGDHGFTKVNFDVFKKIWFPVQREGAEGDEGWYGINMAAQSGSCRQFTTLVENQKTQGHCIFITMADMVSTTIRMILELPNTGLNLSPQPPIDALALKENEDVANFVSDSELGLETSVTYPYWREERHHSRWSAESYRARGKPRYYLNKIDGVSGRQAIRQKLEEHFLGNGRKFPFVGDLFTGELNDRDQATSRFENNTIYSHDAWNHIKADHSVLIVGIDVSNPQAPYVEVKCTWGEHYGDHRFTKVNFDVFKKIWFSVQREGGEGDEG
ncbi:bulb-type lectin domain-containing protein, partial [Tanacetum coccineum]